MVWWQGHERAAALVRAPVQCCVRRWSSWRSVRRQAAQSLVELCLLLAFVAILLVGILSLTGQTVSCSLEPLDSGLAASASSQAPGNSGHAPGQNKTCKGNNGNGNGPKK